MLRLEQRLSSIPVAGRDAAAAGVRPGTWQPGQLAATRSGWQGTITSLDAVRGRATLEANGARVEVDLDDLEPIEMARARRRPGSLAAEQAERPGSGRRGDFGAGTQARGAATTAAVKGSAGAVGARRGGPARAIPASLDLRGARVEEAIELLESYLDAAAMAEAGRVTVIHGHGSGALRDAVRSLLASHPLVREWRPGDRGEGGDGATIVSL